jgi:hypothetical protein
LVLKGIQKLVNRTHLSLNERVSVILDEFNGRRTSLGRNRDRRRRRTGGRIVELVHGGGAFSDQ